MTVLLVDAGAIVASLNKSDTYHTQIAAQLLNSDNQLITCEAAISEALYVLRRARVYTASQDVLHDVSLGAYRLPLRLEDRAKEIAKLMQKYIDVPMSFADACLVDLATQFKTGRILTLDSDFQFYRWGRNRKFELLIDL